jgi:hypothetical protein
VDASTTSPAASEITIAGIIRCRSIALADGIVGADMVAVGSFPQRYYC